MNIIRLIILPTSALALSGYFVLANTFIDQKQKLGDTTIPIQTLKSWKTGERTPILSDDAKTPICFTGAYPYPTTTYTEISPSMVSALIAAEDHSFWTNPGYDLRGITRAAFNTLTKKSHEGASTLTQQLAKIVFMNGRSNTPDLKIQQILLASDITQAIPKQKIMELYLNLVWFGHNANGIRSASSYYLSKTPDSLTLPEAAMLAGIIKNPANLDPFKNPAATHQRRDHVLKNMLDMGMITEADFNTAINTPIILAKGSSLPHTQDTTPVSLGWACDEIKKTSPDPYRSTINIKSQYGLSLAFALSISETEARFHTYKPVLSSLHDGQFPTQALQNYTGLLPEWSSYWLKNPDGTFTNGKKTLPPKNMHLNLYNHRPVIRPGEIIAAGNPDPSATDQYLLIPSTLNGSALILDAHTGDLKATIGGRHWTPAGLNRNSSMRPPGSTLKPFMYLAALDLGWEKNDIVFDIPVSITIDGNQIWTPQNDNNDTAGPITLTQALTESRNLALVNLSQQIGLENITRLLRSTGLYSNTSNPSIVLGSQETSPYALARAYTTLTNNGKILPISVTPNHPTTSSQIESPDHINNILSIMQLVGEHGGTLSRIASQLNEITARDKTPFFTKTGTSQTFFDTWIVSIHQNDILISRMGYDSPSPIGKDAYSSETISTIIPYYYNLQGKLK